MVFKRLKTKVFDPLIDDPRKLSDSRGVYIICVKRKSSLPKQMLKLKYASLNGLPVIYVGKAEKSRYERDYKSHFKGTARNSTLRMSLGVLFGLKKEPLPNSKYRFVQKDEQKLSKWMEENILLHYIECDHPAKEEEYLIAKFSPPLNIKDNLSPQNRSFRKNLKDLRKYSYNV